MTAAVLVVVAAVVGAAVGWPDGAPCIRRILNSIDPAEGAPHRFGAQDGDAPFNLRVRANCYRPGQEIRVELERRDGGPYFRGFAMQAIRQDNAQRDGAFTRDKNGAWKYQCLQDKAAITHSYNGDKTQLQVMWATEINHEQPIKFVATVVTGKSLYWTKGLHSVVLPHCRHAQEFQSLNKASMRPLPRPAGPPPRLRPPPPPPTTTAAPVESASCADGHVSCVFWAEGSNCESNLFVKENCRLSCGVCFRPKAPPLPLFEPEPRLAVLDHNVFATCSDTDEGCRWWTDRCFSDFHVRENCDLSCGRCGKEKAVSERVNGELKVGRCSDAHPGCSGWRNRCNSETWVAEHCQASCGQCILPTDHLDRAIDSPSSCTDRYGNCGQWRQACGRDRNIENLCPATCGLCPTARFQNLRIAPDAGSVQPCEDSAASCERWAGSCGQDAYVDEHCKATCRACPGIALPESTTKRSRDVPSAWRTRRRERLGQQSRAGDFRSDWVQFLLLKNSQA